LIIDNSHDLGMDHRMDQNFRRYLVDHRKGQLKKETPLSMSKSSNEREAEYHRQGTWWDCGKQNKSFWTCDPEVRARNAARVRQPEAELLEQGIQVIRMLTIVDDISSMNLRRAGCFLGSSPNMQNSQAPIPCSRPHPR
jgi:hypothetical protein